MEAAGRDVHCPITGSDDTVLLVSYDQCITSDSQLVNANVENRISRASGLVYNASGARGGEKGFYTDEYDFLSESVLSEWKVFDSSGQGEGLYHQIVDFIDSGIALPRKGRILDIGCGKGLLLKRFSEKYPDWELCAIEPSKNAKAFFEEVMPKVSLYDGNFEDSPYINQTFDLVTASGVLEHVPKPVQFLELFIPLSSK